MRKPETLTFLLIALLAATASDLRQLASRFALGTVSAPGFESGFTGILFLAHAQASALGRRSAKAQSGRYVLPSVMDADWTLAQEQVEREAPFLTGFMADVKAGRYAPKTVAAHDVLETPEPDTRAVEARAALYAERLWNSAQRGWLAEQSEDALITWIAEPDCCADCATLAANGPYRVEELPTTPGDGATQCGNGCRCSLEANGLLAFNREDVSMSDLSKPILFSLSDGQRVEGDYIIRSGKYFPCDRPVTDKNGRRFSITSAEADAILPQTPVWTGPDSEAGLLNVMHEATPFTTKVPGKLGGVQRYWRDGDSIMAEYALHKDIHSFFDGCPLEISSEWNPLTKMPDGAGIVIHPAVTDAVMYMAQFTKRINGDMQDVHDMVVGKGADCPGKAMFEALRAENLKFLTPDTLAALQHVHDHTKENGASCDIYATKKGMYYAAPDDEITKPPAPVPAADKPRNSAGGQQMGRLAKLRALFGLAGVPEEKIDEHMKDLDLGSEADPEVEKMKVQMQAMRQDSLRTEALHFAESLIRDEKRAWSCEREVIVAAFMQAVQDDDLLPVKLQFSGSDGQPKQATRLETLKALFAARAPHQMLDELMKDPELMLMANHAFTRGVDGNGNRSGDEDARKEADRLLSMTDVGRAALKDRTNGSR